MMEKVISYRGYDLVNEEFDDSDGFVKNHYTIMKGDKHIKTLGYTYTSGVMDQFKQIVDQFVDKKLPAGFDGTPVG